MPYMGGASITRTLHGANAGAVHSGFKLALSGVHLRLTAVFDESRY